jgi:hypothetical protein
MTMTFWPRSMASLVCLESMEAPVRDCQFIFPSHIPTRVLTSSLSKKAHNVACDEYLRHPCRPNGRKRFSSQLSDQSAKCHVYRCREQNWRYQNKQQARGIDSNTSIIADTRYPCDVAQDFDYKIVLAY